MNKILVGDCLIKLKELEDNSVDSICCDPPYELGFMGKSWDNTGIANNVEMWKECLRVLKPGGHLLSFSGTRTYHRMASAIEDAGFEVRDMIEWVYGSGFPKSLNIGKAVDKLQGNEREVVGTKEQPLMTNHYGKGLHNERPVKELNVTKGTSEWEGWGTALKPAHEPICMARKPLAEKTVAENVLKWGTGGINIDESRVETSDLDPNHRKIANKTTLGTTFGSKEEISSVSTGDSQLGTLGRFPANLIHDNSEEVRECFPETKSSGGLTKNVPDSASVYGKYGVVETMKPTDSGSASRFFKSIIYQAKASKSERNKGCEGLEEKFMTEQNKWTENDYRKGEGEKTVSPTKNNHPTVKPIALMEYLIKMVTPKGGIVLDPFAGSGSTLVAAKQNGYQYIGIEMTEEYIPIIEARLNEKTNNHN